MGIIAEYFKNKSPQNQCDLDKDGNTIFNANYPVASLVGGQKGSYNTIATVKMLPGERYDPASVSQQVEVGENVETTPANGAETTGIFAYNLFKDPSSDIPDTNDWGINYIQQTKGTENYRMSFTTHIPEGSFAVLPADPAMNGGYAPLSVNLFQQMSANAGTVLEWAKSGAPVNDVNTTVTPEL